MVCAMRRLTHFIVLAAFIFSCGGQWYALQCIAWVKMISDYSQMVPLTEAVSMTFSGQYPCAICKALAEKPTPDNDKSLAFEKYEKKQIASSVVVPSIFPQVVSISYLDQSVFLCTRNDAPPIPPPRAALI